VSSGTTQDHAVVNGVELEAAACSPRSTIEPATRRVLGAEVVEQLESTAGELLGRTILRQVSAVRVVGVYRKKGAVGPRQPDDESTSRSARREYRVTGSDRCKAFRCKSFPAWSSRGADGGDRARDPARARARAGRGQ